MLKDILWKSSGIEYTDAIIVRDADSLWQLSGASDIAASYSFACHMASDSIELRYLYEKNIRIDHEKCIILYSDSFMPFDIEKSMTVFDASFEKAFDKLDADTLRSFRNINLDLLSIAYKDVFYTLGRDDTEDFCCGTIWKTEYLDTLTKEYRAECDALLQNEATQKTWLRIADHLGFILMASRMGAGVDGFEGWYAAITTKFGDWMKTDYRKLSGTPTKQQPYLLSSVNDFIRRNNDGKVALVVLDGMSFADYHQIQRDLARSNFTLQTTGAYSFVPSITSIARQSLFSGKLPIEHPKPFDLTNEEKQFRSFWMENGYKDSEIFFAKSEGPEWPRNTKVAGIVINIVDDLMHSELQGEKGMFTGLGTWLESGNLSVLINHLLQDGFTVYITADHGNTSAIAQGRFSKPTIITENASRRAVIYQSFAGAEELDKFSVIEYTGQYVPKDYRYFAFEAHSCYGDKGTEYISHGGMTIEEMIIPFVRIGV